MRDFDALGPWENTHLQNNLSHQLYRCHEDRSKFINSLIERTTWMLAIAVSASPVDGIAGAPITRFFWFSLFDRSLYFTSRASVSVSLGVRAQTRTLGSQFPDIQVSLVTAAPFVLFMLLAVFPLLLMLVLTAIPVVVLFLVLVCLSLRITIIIIVVLLLLYFTTVGRCRLTIAAKTDPRKSKSVHLSVQFDLVNRFGRSRRR
jgi:hypothetical protein